MDRPQTEPATPGNSAALRISVVLPTYNRSGLMATCIASLEAQTLAASAYEIVVVDDGSTDDTARVAASIRSASRAQLTYVLGAHGGPAAARNLGIRTARAPIVAFIDDDCTADSSWLQEILRPFDTSGTTGVEGAVLRGLGCTPFTHFVENLHGRLYLTANVAYRRDALLAIHGFDESYHHAAAEDWDLAFRLIQRGGRIVFQPTAQVIHAAVPVSGRYFVDRVRERESGLRLYKRYPELWRQTTGRTMRRSFAEGIFLRPVVEARKWSRYFEKHPAQLPAFLYWQVLASGRLLAEYVRLLGTYGPLDR
jgi:glycosyltransferase involved in cell wall biosynthesis